MSSSADIFESWVLRSFLESVFKLPSGRKGVTRCHSGSEPGVAGARKWASTGRKPLCEEDVLAIPDAIRFPKYRDAGISVGHFECGSPSAQFRNGLVPGVNVLMTTSL